MFVFSLYQSSLLSSLLDRKEYAPFSSTGDLAPLVASGEYYMLESTDEISPFYYVSVKYSQESPFKNMKAALEKNPLKVVLKGM